MRENSRVMTRNPDTNRRDHAGDLGTWESLMKATSQARSSNAGNLLQSGKIYPLEVPQKRGRLDDSIRRVVFGIVSLLPMHDCEK
jgi:hypothetical protein